MRLHIQIHRLSSTLWICFSAIIWLVRTARNTAFVSAFAVFIRELKQATFLRTRTPTGSESSRYWWRVMATAVLVWNHEPETSLTAVLDFKQERLLLSITARFTSGWRLEGYKIGLHWPISILVVVNRSGTISFPEHARSQVTGGHSSGEIELIQACDWLTADSMLDFQREFYACLTSCKV